VLDADVFVDFWRDGRGCRWKGAPDPYVLVESLKDKIVHGVDETVLFRDFGTAVFICTHMYGFSVGPRHECTPYRLHRRYRLQTRDIKHSEIRTQSNFRLALCED
jgi:hypothetical protein